jgi:uncharacterized protein (TIGR02117 family)
MHSRSAVWVLLLLLAQGAAGCAAPAPDPNVASEPRSEAIYVIAGGWHTELALPLPLIGGPLAALKPAFPGARYLVFGWGARDYYMAQDPGFAEVLRAMTPGPAVMLVVPLYNSPEAFAGAGNAVLIYLSRQGAARLSQLLWDYLAKDRAGVPLPIAAGPYSQSVFYMAAGSYHSGNTCNSWTAQALRVAGLPVRSEGVVFADQVLDQLGPFAQPAPGSPR